MSAVCSSRRGLLKNLLKGAGGLAIAGAVPNSAFASGYLKSHSKELIGDRALTFYNRHTGERHQASYWVDGVYQPQAIAELDHLLRDHRQNEVKVMDRNLYDLLYLLQERLETTNEIHIISGFRSAKTNEMLAARSGGVARKSYHMKGMAMDIAIPGIDLKHLQKAALSMRAGGVGYYARSGFVHVDTGRVRSW